MKLKFTSLQEKGEVEVLKCISPSRKSVKDLQKERIFTDFGGFSRKTKGFWPVVYKSHKSEMPLVGR